MGVGYGIKFRSWCVPLPMGSFSRLIGVSPGKAVFLKNPALIKTALKPLRGRFFGGGDVHRILRFSGISPFFVILSIHALPTKKQKRTKNKKIFLCKLLRPVIIIFDVLVFPRPISLRSSISVRTGWVLRNFIVIPLVFHVLVRWHPLQFHSIVEVSVDNGMLHGTTSLPYPLHFPGSNNEMNSFF